MDPHFETEPDGLADPNKADDPAEYLRRLKSQGSEGSPSAPPTSGSVVPAAAGSPAFQERRRSPRLQCSGSAEFRPEGSDVRMWGTLTDISLHGCYVEMNNTFPLGTRMALTLEALGIRVRVQGTVRVSYPFLGMGICFSEIEPGQQLQLEQLLAALAGQSSLTTSADVDAKAMIDELTEFFRSNHLLSREEFYRIAKRARL